MMHPGVALAIRALGDEIELARLSALEKNEIGLVLNRIALMIQVTNDHARRSLYNDLPPECRWRRR